MDDESETTQRITQLTPLADVLARIASLVAPVAPQVADIAQARGRVLAADIVAPAAIPSAACALRDGYAVSSSATLDAGGYAPALLPAPPVRVDAGTPLPPGTDAVATFDSIVLRDGRYEALTQVAPGEGVLPANGDIGAGTILRRAGWRLRDIDFTVLLAAGINQVTVRAPRVRLVLPRGGDASGLDATSVLVTHALAAKGAVVIGGRAFDLAAALNDANADAVIIIGGTGGGQHDRSVHTLARVGRVEAHGIAISPGETTAFGIAGSQPVLLLPGRLDAALAAWLLLGRPMLAQLSGCTETEPTTRAKLTRKVASSLGLAEVVPVRVRDGGAEPIASGYVPLGALAKADGWILIAAGSEGYPPGAEVMIQAWP